MIQAIVTDIEGTTSSIRFVHEVLFPYAARHMESFITTHAGQPEVAEQLHAVAAAANLPADDTPALCRQLLAWIQEDKKITPLKALQGMIWKQGYARGDFTGHMYPDACDNLRRWHRQGLRLYVYSSGSVAAQQLLFRHSDCGDLTPLFSGYFDTRIGGKKETDSYRAIAQQVQLPPHEVLFLSDVPAELHAAAQAGLRVCQLVRDTAAEAQQHFPAVTRFDDVLATV